MRDFFVPEYRKRFWSLIPVGTLLVISGFVLYGWLGKGLWMALYFPALAVVALMAVRRQTSVRCPSCGRIVAEKEHHEGGRPIVFLCRLCDSRLVTDVPHPWAP